MQSSGDSIVIDINESIRDSWEELFDGEDAASTQTVDSQEAIVSEAGVPVPASNASCRVLCSSCPAKPKFKRGEHKETKDRAIRNWKAKVKQCKDKDCGHKRDNVPGGGGQLRGAGGGSRQQGPHRKANNVTAAAVTDQIRDLDDRRLGNQLAARELGKQLQESEKLLEESNKKFAALEKKSKEMRQLKDATVRQKAQQLNVSFRDSKAHWWRILAAYHVGFGFLFSLVYLSINFSWASMVLALVASQCVAYSLDRVIVSVTGRNSLYSKGVWHHYEFVQFLMEQFSVDTRADAIALKDLKHEDPIVVVVKYTTRKPWCNTETVLLTASYEILAQISVSKNHCLTTTAESAWLRICHTANHINTVDLNRYLACQGKPVVQHTCLVSFAIFMQMLQHVEKCPFPRPQPLV